MHRGQSAVRQSLNDWKYTLSRYGRNPRSRAAYATLPQKILTSILIANRGEIALRVGKTAALYGIKTTTIYTDPDAKSQHALSSPYAINLGHSSAYLDGDNIIAVAKDNGCVGIHPGYGFVNDGYHQMH
ncbi:uncharacterized protein KY384_000619 [Bacidia gigantensis]|uniref:uncharacterized protein n=1 Tax=Bacidia gigantensis TaxID=2732470 RepID=UPI001D05789D|nr:uncharacterized protein KY384_000619 [Bacidia gigantensis]KAG8525859.1 hypothetical protein KY384_000619 [Bacidia gigantensis]